MYTLSPHHSELTPKVLDELLAEEAKAKAEAETKALLAAMEATPSDAGMPQYLTPESLVAYCDTRLTSLDSQMQAIFNQQQTNATMTQAIDTVAQDLGRLPPPTGSPATVPVSAADNSQIIKDYTSAINTVGAKTGLGIQLQKDLTAFEHDQSGTTWANQTIPSDQLSNLSQNLKTYGSNLNSDSQMAMINLQSLMSQQQTAVQLSTNLLQTLSQTTQSITANMKG